METIKRFELLPTDLQSAVLPLNHIVLCVFQYKLNIFLFQEACRKRSSLDQTLSNPLVGVARIELATSRPPDERSTTELHSDKEQVFTALVLLYLNFHLCQVFLFLACHPIQLFSSHQTLSCYQKYYCLPMSLLYSHQFLLL